MSGFPDKAVRWPTARLKRFARFAYGDALPAEARDENGCVAVFGSNGIVGSHSGANTKAPAIIVGRKGSHGALNWSDSPAFAIDTAYFVDETQSSCNLRWLYWLLHTLRLQSFSQDTAVPGLPREAAHNLACPLPDSAEQQAIADFLDRKTAKIDDLVAEQERLIALIEEKRLAVISHAVTKGLDPRSPMKDSGVEWMGRVPQAWAETALKRVAIAMCDGPFGSGLKSDHYVASGVRVVRLQNIKVNEFAASDAAYVDEEYFRTELGRHEVTAGDLLVAGLGDDRHAVGRACVAPPEIGPAMVKADCFRFRLDRAVALPRFVAMQLSAGAEFDAGRMSTGSTRSRIPLSVMGTRPLLLPSVPEQQAIMAFLDGDETRFNAMKAEATRNIGFLKERRSALISAAVTGKIDVHSIAPPEMDAAA